MLLNYVLNLSVSFQLPQDFFHIFVALTSGVVCMACALQEIDKSKKLKTTLLDSLLELNS